MTSVDPYVSPPPATAIAEVPWSVQILFRTHLWMNWTRIALQHETVAKAARQELDQATPEIRNGFMLQNEADAALVAIAATAFALEAITRELDELVAIPSGTVTAW